MEKIVTLIAAMSPLERRRVKKRAKLMQKTFPNPQDRIAAEKSWRELPWNQPELEKI